MKKLVFILILFNHNLFSQEVQLDTNTIRIGEQTTLRIELKTNNISEINWPIFNDTLISGIEIISISKIDTNILTNQDSIILKQSFIITSWDSGIYHIPAINFDNNKSSSALILNVNSISIDKNGSEKDIKGPIAPKFELKDILVYFIIAIIFLVIAYLLKKYVFVKKIEKEKIEEKELEPPYIIALEALKNVENSKLLETGKIKTYHSKISEILRKYIEQRYAFIALELPTSDILNIIKQKKITDAEINNLKLVLERADLAKFAKNKPDNEENKESMCLSILFVENTKIIPENE
ncbi:MAG: hypothetical protein VX347_03765 [Bacteroidota bacterium]|nr:hypothetical protein [Bacteroidota bacterium]